MSWYCMYGDPRWDDDELWTTMGHLYKGGMWFKKKSVLQAESHYDTEKGADGSTDSRVAYKYYTNTNSSIASGIPSAADANKYFFLPALGYYDSGMPIGVGHNVGYYWSSSASPFYNYAALYLSFNNSSVQVFGMYRYRGLRAQKFSDFGDN